MELAGGSVWWNRVMGELAISRAIGDHKLRPYVIADPEVTHQLMHHCSNDVLLILALALVPGGLGGFGACVAWGSSSPQRDVDAACRSRS